MGNHDGHHHHHGDDFDWVAMADTLELDGAMMLPLVQDIVRDEQLGVRWPGLRHVLDVGCGPGVIACALADHAQFAQVTALDTLAPLLARAQARAAAQSVADRITTVEADLDGPLPDLDPVDLVWASMVLHHVADPTAVLAALLQRLRPGGTLVMIEFSGPSAVLPADDPLLADGTWARLEAAGASVVRERLGLDPYTIDWPSLLADAGYEAVTDRTRVAYHPAPLHADARHWVARHVNRGLDMVGDRIPQADRPALQDLADSVGRRNDLYVRAQRRVLSARRPE